MDRDGSLALLRFEIVGLALPLLIAARQERARPDVGDRVGARFPIGLRLAILKWPGHDTDAPHVLAVDRDRPRQFGAALLAFWHRPGLTDARDDEHIRHDTLGMAHHAVAVR